MIHFTKKKGDLASQRGEVAAAIIKQPNLTTQTPKKSLVDVDEFILSISQCPQEQNAIAPRKYGSNGTISECN